MTRVIREKIGMAVVKIKKVLYLWGVFWTRDRATGAFLFYTPFRKKIFKDYEVEFIKCEISSVDMRGLSDNDIPVKIMVDVCITENGVEFPGLILHPGESILVGGTGEFPFNEDK